MFASRSLAQRVMSTAASTRQASTKVAVLGAGGGIGQPLSLLLKLSPYVDELACYDIVGTPGIAADLSHVSEQNSRVCVPHTSGADPDDGKRNRQFAFARCLASSIQRGIGRSPHRV